MEPQHISQIPALTPNSKTTAASPITDWRPALDLYEPSLRAVAEAAIRFRRDMAARSEPYWLTLSGVNGCGKTAMLTELFKACIPLNPGAASLWAPGEVGELRTRRPRCVWFDEDTFARRCREGEYELPDYLRDDWLVCFDELGFARDPTGFVADRVSRFAEMRMYRWTLWATNLTLEEVAQRMDRRISSRILRAENRIITIKAGDYALRKLEATG